MHNGLVESILYNSGTLAASGQSATKSGVGLLSLGYYYYQNFNAKSQTITANDGTNSLSWTQSFTYDTLSRLLTSTETGSDSWSETFGYDTGHNRWISSSTGQAPVYPLLTPQQNQDTGGGQMKRVDHIIGSPANFSSTSSAPCSREVV